MTIEFVDAYTLIDPWDVTQIMIHDDPFGCSNEQV